MPHPTSRHKATTGELVQAGDPANNAVRVNVVAGAGSGGTAATDDAAFTVGGSSYTPAGGIYRSALDSVDDGDGGAFAMTQTRAIFANLRDDAGDSAMDGANNALRVNIVAGAGSGGTAMTDDAAFTPGGTSFTPAGGTYRSVRDPVDDNDGGVFAMTQNRALLVSIEDSVGDSAMDDANNAVRVNVVAGGAGGVQYTEGDTDATITGTAVMFESNTGTNTLSVVNATTPLPVTVLAAATNIAKAEDAAATSGDTGVALLMMRDDVPVTRTDANLDYDLLRGDSKGQLWVAVGDSRTSIGKAEDSAQNNADVGASILGMRNDALATTTDANFDYSNISVDLAGRVHTNLSQWNGVTPTAAAALASDMANPTAPAVGAFLMGLEGATWDRLVSIGGQLQVSQGSGSTTQWGVGSGIANDQPNAGLFPTVIGHRASTALPTAVSADGDVVYGWANRSGAIVIANSPHIGLNSDPYNLIHETAQYTTTQTSTVLVAGGASEKLVVTKVQIQVGGTTAGTLQLYFGTAAYSRGTSRAIFDGEFAPSTTLKPGVVMDGPWISGTNGDDLLVTTSAAINPLTITVWYYVVV